MNMKKEQQQTAAEQYAALKEDKFRTFLEQSFTQTALKGVQLYEVKCPSGMTFKCRPLDGAYAANAGQMPMALTGFLSEVKANPAAADMTDEDRDNAAQAAFGAMSPVEQRASIQAACQQVQYVAVQPRIVEGEVNGQTNAISISVLSMADFGELAKWAQGGDAASRLKTFRRKRK